MLKNVSKCYLSCLSKYFASVVKSIYALSIAIVFVMTYKCFATPTTEDSD